jgi:hypothetical protein
MSIADPPHVSRKTQPNHRFNSSERLITVATNHEQEGKNHHGHFVHGGFIPVGFIISTVRKGGTGRLLHLFG